MTRTRFHAALTAAILSSAIAGPARAEVLNLTPSKDATLFEDPTGETAGGAAVDLFIGNAGVGARRALLKFDLSAIPAGATINSASLRVNFDKGSSLIPVSAYHVLKDWGEGASTGTDFGAGGGGAGSPAQTGDATWLHTFYNSSFWTSPGGDFDPAARATGTTPASGLFTLSSPGLAADVQGWLANPSDNFGWILVGTGHAMRFDSRTGTVPPRLTIDYSVASGPPTWNVDASGNFGDGANWSGGVPTASSVALFGAAIHADRTVTVNGAFTTAGLTFDNAGASYTLAGAGPLTVNGPIAANAGSHKITSALQLGGALNVANNARLALTGNVSGAATSLTLGTGSTLDLGDNTLSVTTPISDAALRSMIGSAYHAGRWDLPGLTSSAAAADAPHATGVGYRTQGGTTTVRYTLAGDTDLNGVVNQADVQNVLDALPLAVVKNWSQGDFNYDGQVTSDDFALLSLGAAYGTLSAVSVPEPTTLFAALAPVALLASRRRR